MYKRPGKELKDHAESYVYWQTIVAAFVAAFGGMILFPLFSERGEIPVWVIFAYMGVILAATLLAYFICRLKALKLYALGQLVDDVQTIRESMCGHAEQEKVKIDSE